MGTNNQNKGDFLKRGMYMMCLAMAGHLLYAANVNQSMQSAAMGKTVNYNIALPSAHFSQPAERFPVLYALHGMGAPYATIPGMSTVQSAIETTPMYVVSFDCGNSGWYVDATQDPASQYETFFFDEFIPHIDGKWRTRTDGKYRAVTGFSMGGYGALQYMLARPDLFASASSMSGAFDVMGEFTSSAHGTLSDLFGPFASNKQAYIDHGIYSRLDSAQKYGTDLPPVYLTCGTSDTWITDNRRMRDTLISKGYRYEYKEAAGGHDYTFWKAAMEWLVPFHAAWFDSVVPVSIRNAEYENGVGLNGPLPGLPNPITRHQIRNIQAPVMLYTTEGGRISPAQVKQAGIYLYSRPDQVLRKIIIIE